MRILILAFNMGISDGLTNGPGMSLWNFLKFFSKKIPYANITVYTKFKTKTKIDGVRVKTVGGNNSIRKDIAACDIFHCWSGLTKEFLAISCIANDYKRPVILGPNLLDTVQEAVEKNFIETIDFRKILTVNERLKYMIRNKYGLDRQRVDEFIVGPDIDLWSPPDEYLDYILWKGNSKHLVKDIGFAKKVEKKLGKYKFLFMGDKRSYDYLDHISVAKKAKVYISTSMSETKGMALLEQWSAGVPSVTHPKVYQHGRNYETGIITNRDIDSYCESISEIMEDNELRQDLSQGARSFVENKFDPSIIANKYIEVIKDVS